MLLARPVSFDVLGGAVAVPPQVRRPDGRTLSRVENEHVLEALFGERWSDGLDPRWAPDRLRRELGVERRAWTHWIGAPLGPEELDSADLGVAAAHRVLERSQVRPEEIDLLVCATTTPPRPTVPMAAWVAGELGVVGACLDVSAGTAGGLVALLTAGTFLGGGVRTALVVAADTPSKLVPPTLPEVAFSIGDGAAALLLRAGIASTGGLLASFLEMDGEHARGDALAGRFPPTAESLARGDYLLGGDPERHAADAELWAAALVPCFEAARFDPADTDLYLPHQVGLSAVAASAEAAGIPGERTFLNLDRRGRCGAASVLMAFAEALHAGRCPPGATLALAAVGSGRCSAGALLRR